MGQEDVMDPAKKEEELVSLLFGIGIKKNVAKVLMILTKTPKITPRTIGRGTDLHRTEVALVLQYLKKQGWIRSEENTIRSKGRPVKIYELAKPIADIVNAIEKEAIRKADDQLRLIQRLRNCAS